MGYPEFDFGYQKEKNWVLFHFEKVERFLTSWPSPKNFSQLKRIFKQSLPRMLPKNVNLCSELFRVGFPSKTCYLCGKKGWYTKVTPQTLTRILLLNSRGILFLALFMLETSSCLYLWQGWFPVETNTNVDMERGEDHATIVTTGKIFKIFNFWMW